MAGGFAKYSHDTSGSSTSGAASPSHEYTVGAAHGYVAGNLVSIANGPTFSKAIATSEGGLAEAIVVSVTATTITLGFDGVHTITGHGRAVGSWFYLSQTVAGDAGAIPATGWQQRCFFTIDANTILFTKELGIYA